MAVDVKLWSERFPQNGLPSWTCPECKWGKLVLDKDTLKMLEPAFSKAAHSHDAWEPDWIVGRFTARTKCSDANCGEIVHVIGDTVTEEDWDEEHGRGVTQFLRPRSLFPPPPIITLPNEMPHSVAEPLQAAFQLYWTDLGASANRIRTSVERLLDDLKIRKFTKGPKKKPLPLGARIQLFKSKQPEHAEFLDALRIVGNVGTHSDTSRQALLASFEIYEEALAELYGKKSSKLKKLVKKIKKTKGHL